MTGFKVDVLPSGIVKIFLPDFKRETIEEWVAYVRKHDGKLKSPHRVLYNLCEAGYPTPYVLNTSVTLMHELQIPEDTRTAYMVQDHHHAAFGMVIARRMPRKAGPVRVFTEEEEAIKWLLAP